MEILTFEGDELDTLALTLGLRVNQFHRVRFAIDGGTLKVKYDEGTWSPPIYPTRVGS